MRQYITQDSKLVSTTGKHVVSKVIGSPNSRFIQRTGRYLERRLKLIGANVRSLFAPENSYCFYKVLDEHQPDIFFAVETWHQLEDNTNLTNREYHALFSRCDGQRGGGVAIVHRSNLVVAPLFPEFHTRNLVLARLSSHSAWPLLLLAAYFPPDHTRKREMVAHVIRLIEYLHTRYKQFGLIAFGDLNTDFARNSKSPDCVRMMEMIKSCGLDVYRDLNPQAVTRNQNDKSSYLDYFLTTGV